MASGPLRTKAALCGLLGRIDEGRQWVARLLAAEPDWTVSRARRYYGVHKRPADVELFVEGLRKAGLPE